MEKKRFFIALTEPVVELVIESEPDVTGATAKVTAVFKRPSSLEESSNDNNELQQTINKEFNIPDEELKSMSQEDLTTAFERFSEEKISKVNELIKKYLIGLKGVKLSYLNEAGELDSLIIKDSRTEGERVGFWANASECLDILTSEYLSQLPWQSSFVTALIGLLLNKNVAKEAKIKN
jgi:hypothetical protein